MSNNLLTTEDVLLSLPLPIAIVGNGHPRRNMGAVIDRFSTIIRINNYKIEGFEELVGSKTTLRCTSGWEDIDVCYSLPEISPFRFDSHESASIKKYIARGGNPIITPEKDVHILLPEVSNPSTGLALAALASDLGIEIAVFGFDGFSSGHYWDPDTPLITTHSNIEREQLLKLSNVLFYGISYDYPKLYDYCHTIHSDYDINEGLRLYKKIEITLIGERILEFGAGNGQLAAYMEMQGNEVTAIEVSQVAFEKIPVVRKFNGDCLTLAQLEGVYDRFVSIDVLEHLTENDIRIVVREAARLARLILVSVSTRPSGLLGPQGENLHLTIRTVEWWLELFSKYFKIEILPFENVGQVTITGSRHTSMEVHTNELCLAEDSFELPGTYCSRNKAEYFTDSDEVRTGVVWQPDVYSRAIELARELGCNTLIDIGCGHAEKLMSCHPEFNIIGIDFGTNIEWCRSKYIFGTWLESDFEHIKYLPIPNDLLKQSVMICSDVLEHLSDPRALLNILRMLMEVAPALIISTPDRIMTWGEKHCGPPPNSTHTREWSLAEFRRLLEREGFTIDTISHTRSNNLTNELATIIAIVISQNNI